MLAYTDIFVHIQEFLAYCAEQGVQLVLATKTIDQATLQQVNRDFPDLVFGENRVQELCDKYFEGAHWIFIGRLQRNKVKYLVDKVEMICSVDSTALAEEIQRQCAKHGKTMPVLVEVNLGEIQKGGVSREELCSLLDFVKKMPNLSLVGLMAVLPQEGASRSAQEMRAIWQDLRERYSLFVLSMGMSEDYRLAVEQGSTMIRIGSAVFGKRS